MKKKMIFKENKFANGELIFKAGEVYEVSEEGGSVARWLKRGGEIVENDSPAKAPKEVSKEEALDALGEEEEFANEDSKKENKKAKKSSK
jgi:hypothetical protein